MDFFKQKRKNLKARMKEQEEEIKRNQISLDKMYMELEFVQHRLSRLKNNLKTQRHQDPQTPQPLDHSAPSNQDNQSPPQLAVSSPHKEV